MKYIITILAMVMWVSVAHSAVILNAVKPIDADKSWIFITLTVDGDICRYTSVTPWNSPGPPLTGEALQTWCDNREPWFAVNILKGLYPNARYQSLEGDTDLAKFTAWVSAGHVNAAYCRKAEGATQQQCQDAGGTWIPEQVITKVPWVDSWSITKVTAENDMKTSILANKTDAQIQAYIEANVTDLTSSKIFLYRLTKEVRDIIRRQGWE